jgi:hypothetical protein
MSKLNQKKVYSKGVFHTFISESIHSFIAGFSHCMYKMSIAVISSNRLCDKTRLFQDVGQDVKGLGGDLSQKWQESI